MKTFKEFINENNPVIGGILRRSLEAAIGVTKRTPKKVDVTEKTIEMSRDVNDYSIEHTPSLEKFRKSNTTDLGSVDNHRIFHVHKGPDHGDLRKDRILLYHNEKPSGSIEYIKKNNEYGAFNIALHTKHQGKGTMSKVFKHVMDSGINLVPSGDHTEGGLKVWKRLGSK